MTCCVIRARSWWSPGWVEGGGGLGRVAAQAIEPGVEPVAGGACAAAGAQPLRQVFPDLGVGAGEAFVEHEDAAAGEAWFSYQLGRGRSAGVDRW